MLCHIKGTVKEKHVCTVSIDSTCFHNSRCHSGLAHRIFHFEFVTSWLIPVKNVFTTNCSGTFHIVGCCRFLIIKIFSYVCAIVSVA